MLVVDNDSRDASATAAERPGVRLIRNPTNRYLSPAWNQGAAATDAPYLLFLNPDTEWFRGTLEDLVRVGAAHPRAGIVGPMVRNPDGTVYPCGAPFPSVTDAVGHAFLSPVTRDNRFTRRYEMDGWDRTTEREVDWVSGACMLFPRAAFDAGGWVRRGLPAVRRGARHRDAPARRRLERAVHAGGRAAPRGRGLHRRSTDVLTGSS